MGFLPEGLELERSDEELVPVNICQADDDGPSFVVQVRMLPIKEYRKVFRRLQQDQGGFRQNNSQQDKVDRDYLDKVVVGWDGLTIANWNALVRDGKKITGDNVDEFEKKKAEIPHSSDAAFYVYRNSWPQDFGNKVFEVVQQGAEEEYEEEEDLSAA